MGPAARLIADEKFFWPGTLYRNEDGSECFPGLGQIPYFFDCLGAFLWAYHKVDKYDRHITARRVFEACRARYDHTRLGKLTWEPAFELLRDCGV